MESDDDYQAFSYPKEASPLPQYRRLKRLKKSDSKLSKEPLPELFDDPIFLPHVDFARLEALENDSEYPEFSELNSTEELDLFQESLSRGDEDESEMGNDDTMDCGFKEEVKKTKRVLEFDDDAAGGEDGFGGEKETGEGGEEFEPEKKIANAMDLLEEKKEKTKRKKKNTFKSDSSKATVQRSNKRREEKERRAYLEELHAESQKVLRETRNATFKPIPVVHKPISSVLEKIRKRKLEISKKAVVVSDSSLSEVNVNSGDKLMEIDASIEDRDEQNVMVAVEKEIVSPYMDGDSSLATSDVDEYKDFAKQTNHENDGNKESPEEEPTPAFRAPVHNTQDLFDDSEPNGDMAEPNNEQPSDPLEEDIVPSLLPLNLKFDSIPEDDSSSDEEDNDKENVDPHPIGTIDSGASPKGDPVKAFVDDEAVEEDDSDNDPNCNQGNAEEEDLEDLEELNDMIATGYEEKLTDKERRNELHQKWLEQQDAAGTDKIMQRLGCGSELRDAILSDKDSETDEEDEEFDDEAREDSMPQNHAKMNTKKAKQMILQFLSEKEDTYLSDDEGCKHMRHAQYVIRNEEQATKVPPADDESSREVFGLIKKLNIVPDQKKKPKPFSLFDSVLKWGNSTGSSKSSFLGRVSNAPIPSSHRQGSGSVRHFIFGRDDSNSRSSISASEDSSDTISQEIQHTKTVTAKYCSSQVKFSSQTRNGGAAETATKTSLMEILKRPSLQSQVCNRDTTIDLTKSIFTFRASKKPMKIEPNRPYR